MSGIVNGLSFHNLSTSEGLRVELAIMDAALKSDRFSKAMKRISIQICCT